MAPECLTEIGRKWKGIADDIRSQRECVQFDHDILVLAAQAQPPLDVDMLCFSLHEQYADVFFREVTGSSFAELVEAVLKAGAHVRIFVWNILQQEDGSSTGVVSQSILALGKKAWSAYLDCAGSSRFELACSNTREGAGDICSFLIATGMGSPHQFWRVSGAGQGAIETGEDLYAAAGFNADMERDPAGMIPCLQMLDLFFSAVREAEEKRKEWGTL